MPHEQCLRTWGLEDLEQRWQRSQESDIYQLFLLMMYYYADYGGSLTIAFLPQIEGCGAKFAIRHHTRM